jgi:hypothetical protein
MSEFEGGTPRPRRKRWYEAYVPPLSPEERARALADPGPTWTQYFLRDFVRWWGVLLFFVVDAWIVASFLNPLFLIGMLPLLLAALYLEYAAYLYLWRRPNLEKEARRGPFVRTWYRPVRFGRWTAEMEELRAGFDPARPSPGPDPREFL